VAAPEELFEAREIGDIERRRAACADLVGCLLEALRIASGDDQLGAVGASRAVSRPMPELPPINTTVWPTRSCVGCGVNNRDCRGHGCHRESAANTALVAVPNTRCADRSSRSVRVSYSQIGCTP
jgi:hypothetical protein